MIVILCPIQAKISYEYHSSQSKSLEKQCKCVVSIVTDQAQFDHSTHRRYQLFHSSNTIHHEVLPCLLLSRPCLLLFGKKQGWAASCIALRISNKLTLYFFRSGRKHTWEGDTKRERDILEYNLYILLNAPLRSRQKSLIRYDVGGYHTCLSRRIPGFESQYRNLFAFLDEADS